MTALKSKDEERRKKVPSRLHCFQKIDKDGVGDQKAAGCEGIKAAGKMGEAVGFTIPEDAPRGSGSVSAATPRVVRSASMTRSVSRSRAEGAEHSE